MLQREVRGIAVALHHATARQNGTPHKYGERSNSDSIPGVSHAPSEQLRDRDSLMSDLRHEISNLLCANSRRGGAMLKMLVFCDFEIAHYGLIPKSRLLGTPFRRTISTLQAPF